MADCSKTLEYSKEFSRMCNHYGDLWDCEGCPLQANDYQCENRDITQEVIDIVQKWSDEHPDIKPCPFCGESDFVELCSDADYIDDPCDGHIEQFQVCCNAIKGGCGSCGGFRDTEEEALELWNKRLM